MQQYSKEYPSRVPGACSTSDWGYQTFGCLMIPADKIPLDGQLTVTLTKFPNAEDVAVNKEC